MADLSKSELEAMRVLWEKGAPLKPAEIQDGFSWSIDNGTLRSTLRVLMEKGHVKRKKKGKAFHYQPTVSREGMLQSMVRRMADVFSGGSAADLIAQLVKTEKLSPDEIEELRRIAEEKAPKSRAKGRRKAS